MAKAIRHHVEESAGIDRGRRLRETRELKTRKQQVGDERGGGGGVSKLKKHAAAKITDERKMLSSRTEATSLNRPPHS